MARKRMVSPELLTSTTVADLPVPTRYAWIALWMYADDMGRGVDNAALIRAHTWPLDTYSAAKVEKDMQKMAAAGLICRYSDDGKRLFHIPTWHDWQKVNHPTPSKLAPCPGHEPDLHRAFTEDSRRTQGGLPPKSVQGSSREGSSSDPTGSASASAGRPGRPESHFASDGKCIAHDVTDCFACIREGRVSA